MISAVAHCLRLARVGFVLAREGAFALVDASVLPPAGRLGLRLVRLVERRRAGDEATRLAAAITRLGPSYVKFGQFLATRPDVVGVRVARDLEALQDRMPPFPRAEAVRVVEEAFGQPVTRLFVEFGEPMAAASIAQVHKARIGSGAASREVAVKVLRPGVRDRFMRDLAAMRFAAGVARRFMPDAERLRPLEVVETLARSVAMEMDLRLEAAALSELAENTAEDADFRVPKVEWDLTARDVLTSEWVDGLPLSDLAAVEAAGHDRVALSRAVIQSFLRQALRDGFFHADMHPGNLFVAPDGRLVAVDCGIMGRLGPKERRFLAEILYGFIRRDYRRVAEVHFEAGYVPHHHSIADFAQAIRAIGEPIHDRRADEISMARLLTLLFEITALFDMRTRTELVMLQKTMVVVEGVARSLDPKLDMWSTADPVVRQWIERNLGPIGRLAEAGRDALSVAGFLSHVPGLLTRGERLVEQLEVATGRGFALAPESVAAISRGEAHRTRWGNLALWVIAGLLAIILLRDVF
ncbi:2-polyprenylphenol 6-hydroxylase [Chelatococcus sp. SYSU_G07232]|uniref:2-polyprenylphenol 6-hydroxylase n=1 Tax=Chelatococcus albus TaxID=3047466 RepID=A0ABT7AHN2_9HYPH|nr:2-polyprenylphenol 6-hydroxylase [Chelatococcus sp. SYSU_G07232]MDJ1158869.1 2-polyprenylphenol 6-hydroxylase [Chelatococcus sp. SYSU_G07232]